MNKNKIQELTVELDTQIQNAYTNYQALHKELETKYANRKLEESEVPAVKQLIEKIQEAFSLMWPGLNFIASRATDAEAITENHTKFIRHLSGESEKSTCGDNKEECGSCDSSCCSK